MAAPTPVQSVTALLRAIEKSNLLSAETLAKVRETAAALTDPKAVALALYKDGTLTRWQSDQLLHGYHRLIVGKYKLLDQLETSPTGRIYLAEHVQMGRRHALKVLAKRLVKNPEAVARFLKGAQNACGLDHRNISHVYDVSQDRQSHYVVMEYVEGQNLEQLVEKRGPLKLTQALDYLWQVAAGLAYAHSHGVVHGDLKPSNLVRDNNGVIKILEIGQDGAGAEPETDDADQDIETASLAAVIFQAPEMRGDGEAADIACDVYSLGSVLTFLLTGKAAKNAAAAVEHLRTNKTIAEEIVDLCRTWMADNVADRPHSIDVVLSSIETAMAKAIEANKLSVAKELSVANNDRNQNVAAETPPAAPPVAIVASPPKPVIAVEEVASPAAPPPQSEFVIQTHDRSRKEAAGTKKPARTSRSPAVTLARSSPLFMAGAIGGAAIFVLGIVTLVVLLVAFNRPAKSASDVAKTSTPAAEQPIAQPPVVQQPSPPELAAKSPEPAIAAAVPPVDSKPAPDAPAPAANEPTSLKPVAAAAQAPASHPADVNGPAAGKVEVAESPAAIVAAVPNNPLRPETPAAPAAPIAPVAKKATGGSTKTIVRAITLPPVPEPDSTATASSKPVSLGPCDSDATTAEIALLGGDTAIRSTRQKFELQPRAMSSGEWNIQLSANGNGNGEPAIIAALSLKNGELLFQWTEEAAKQSLVARQLMNCALALNKSKQMIALRAPQKGSPLVIDIEKPSASVKWSLNNLPLAKQIFLDVTRTEGFPKLRQEPKGPTNAGDSVTIGTGPAEKSIPLLFKLNTSSAAAAIEVRSQTSVKFEGATARNYFRKDLLATQSQQNAEVNRLAAELRKAKDSRPRLDPERQAREAMITRLAGELTLANIVLDQVNFVLDFGRETEGAAKIHFRVYFLAGDVKIDLLTTSDDDNAN